MMNRHKTLPIKFVDQVRPGRIIILYFLAFIFLYHDQQGAYAEGDRSDRIIQGVPFFSQEDYQCGPSSLAGVINFWGVKVTPQEIADKIYSKSAGGTLDVDIIRFSEKYGLASHKYKGGLDDLRKNIDNGYPLIILVDFGFLVYKRTHYMVVVGYTEGSVIVNSGKEIFKQLTFAELIGLWERTQFWTLLITPKEKAIEDE
jgi:ABC-type bacteriocin/lantibiotic exporter with double-glycine peptidase domain